MSATVSQRPPSVIFKKRKRKNLIIASWNAVRINDCQLWELLHDHLTQQSNPPSLHTFHDVARVVFQQWEIQSRDAKPHHRLPQMLIVITAQGNLASEISRRDSITIPHFFTHKYIFHTTNFSTIQNKLCSSYKLFLAKTCTRKSHFACHFQYENIYLPCN